MEQQLFSESKMPLANETQKVKNLSALVIVLAGLFVGSLFVDVAQLAMGTGFSGRAIKTHNVLETAGRTWVAFTDPKVSVEVITDKECAPCDPSEALVWLRRVLPTLEVTQTESSSEAGKKLIEQFSIPTLPAFIFSQSVARTDFYTQASSLFTSKDNRSLFDMNALGMPVGKYLNLPEVRDDSITTGSKDAKVKIIEFSDFQCPYCKAFHKILANVLKEYEGEVLFVYKHLPLPIHPQAENAALAAECANAQGKFTEYADYLFAKQDDWGRSRDTKRFKDYAWYLRLDGKAFSACLDSRTYANKIEADTEEAARFSIGGTPGTFINETLLQGAVSEEELRAVIDKALAQ